MARTDPRATLAERIDRLSTVDDNGCWVWTGTLDKDGYGRIYITVRPNRSQGKLAHRVAYEHLVGPIAQGLTLDHTCRVRACVNPLHLEPVTLAENIARGDASPGKARCVNGHELTPENTYWRSSSWRECRTCIAIHARAYRARRAALNVRTAP